jgi:iron complex transport system ATP-binding protein
VSAVADDLARADAPALRVAGLHVRLGGHVVLDEVSFDVGPGEVVGVLGRNGAGKTTLLRVAGGTQRADAGRVEIGGRDAATLSRRERARRVATVPQDVDARFPFTGGEIVRMGRTPHQGLLGLESKHDIEMARDALARVGAAELADRRLGSLSGGERQLVLFARALAQDPDVLLLDEPTSHLDLRHRVDVLGIVRGLAREGRAALIVSHDLGLAARACDRWVVLANGRVHADGAPADILDARLLASAFGMDAEVVHGSDGLPLVVPRIER